MTHTPATRSDTTSPSEAQTDAFYLASALGLAWLDARESTPRRFGPAADASWRNYIGTPADLHDLDRLELLLRDGGSVYPDAFSPRAVFSLPGLTDDEPFGQWRHTPAEQIPRSVFRTPPTPSPDVVSLLTEAARLWSLPLGACAPLRAIGPTTHLLVAGAAALVVVAARFAENRDLALREQVVVVTDDPALRHLAGLAALALGELHAPRCVSASIEKKDLPAHGVTALDVLVSSDDAPTTARVAAETWIAPATL